MDRLPDIVIAVTEELPENVNGHDTETAVCFDMQDRKHSLVEDGIANILGRVGVRSNLPRVSAGLHSAHGRQ